MGRPLGVHLRSRKRVASQRHVPAVLASRRWSSGHLADFNACSGFGVLGFRVYGVV